MSKHSEPVMAVAFSPDDKTIASGSEDKLIYIWNTETGEAISTLEGHTGKVQFLEFSPDGKYLLSSGGTQIFLWNLETGLPRSFSGQTHQNPRFSLMAHNSLADLLNKFRLWDRIRQ
jgi:WD40 repeat protein